MPPCFGHHFQGILLRILPLVPCAVTPTGLSPSKAQLSSCFGFPHEGLEEVLQLHIPSDFRHQVRFALCRFRSPLLPASRLLSFPPGTKMFPFPGFPSPAGDDGSFLPPGSPIQRSWVQRLPAPRPSVSPLATTFLGARAKPFPRWLRLSSRNPTGIGITTCARHSSCAERNLPFTREVHFTCCINMWTRRDSNPRPSACKADALPLSYRPIRGSGTQNIKGGDRAAGSPTATLLRLKPSCRTRIRPAQPEPASSEPYSSALTGGVCKEQGRIHRAMMTRGY